MNRTSRKLTLIALFAALYVILSFIPISMFIGAPSYLSLNLVIVPLIAFMLAPTDALVSAVLGGIIALYINPGQAMFGVLSVLLPVAGSFFGSATIHYEKKGKILSAGFLSLSIILYLVRNYTNPMFVSPHILALGLILLSISSMNTLEKFKVPIFAFISTMCEQGMMMIFAVHILALPAGVFDGILPLMLYERLTATVGATLLVYGVRRTLPDLF